MSLAHRLLKSAHKAALQLVPKNRTGDYLCSLAHFVTKHRRLPRRRNGSMNDALFWIRTSGELLNERRVMVSDKEHVKDYIASAVGHQYNVPTIAVLRSIEAARAATYPSRCVIKPTHLSGKVLFRRNGEAIDFGILESWFSMNHYSTAREANYRFLQPKVIVEPILFDSDSLEDFKIFCVNGAPRFIQVDSDRYTAHKRNYYSVDWQLLPFSIMYPSGMGIAMPNNLREMLSVAERASRPFSFLRVDLYTDGQRIYVGELTNCPDAAIGNFIPASGEAIAAKLLFGEAGFTVPAHTS